MPTTRSNQGQAPVNADTFDLTGDLAKLVDSMQVVVTVANDAAGDVVATARASAGFAVSDARPLFTYNQATKTIRVKDSSGWRELSRQIQHAEYTSGSVSQTANVGAAFGTLSADGSRTFNNSFVSPSGGSLTINQTGAYDIWFSAIGASSMGTSVQLWSIGGSETKHSSNYNSYGGNTVTGQFSDYILSGTTLSFGVTGSNTFNFTGRIKVTKTQG